MKVEYGPTYFIIGKSWHVLTTCPSCQEVTGLRPRDLYSIDGHAHWVKSYGTSGTTGKFRCTSTW